MKFPPCAALAFAATLIALPAGHAAVILSTDFSGRTVSGKTASNITWVTGGVGDPGDLTWVLESGGPTNTALFDTANAQGHFAPDLNIENEGPWSATIPLALAAPQVQLDEVVLDWQHFNNSGVFQAASRLATWTVSVIGSVSGEIASASSPEIGGTSGIESIRFAAPVSLDNSETYGLKIFVTGNGPGNNTGLDGVTVNGSVVPEPSAPAMISAALAMLGIIRRRPPLV